MADRGQLFWLFLKGSEPPSARPSDFERPQFLGVDPYELFVRLLAYATTLVRSHSRGSELPNDSAQDLVQTAFVKVASGERRYKKKIPPLVFMMGIIRSDFYHLLEKHGKSGVVLSIVNGTSHEPATIVAETIAATTTDSCDTTILLLASKWLDRLREEYGEDSLPVRYVELIASGEAGTAATDLAKALDVTVADIFNLNRLLRRFVKRYQAKTQTETS